MRAPRALLAPLALLALVAACGPRRLATVPPIPAPECLGTDVRWVRGLDAPNQGLLDIWCESVGVPVLGTAPGHDADVRTLVIASWNMHVGGGRVDALIHSIRVARARRVDRGATTGIVLVLQEAFRAGRDVPSSFPPEVAVPGAIRPERPVPDIEALAQRLQMSVAYVPSMRNGSAVEESSREDRGNAVLSTEPLSDVTAIELPFGHQRRVAVMATVTPRGPRATPVRVIAVHLDTRSARTAQSAAFADQIRQLSASGPPIVVGADLNAISGFNDVAFKTVNASIPAEECGRRSTLRFPPWRMDFMFSTLASSAQRTCETLPEFYGSDHRPVVMTINY